MERYYLSVDGGGSKIIAILFNDRWELIGMGTGGSTNSNHSKKDHVKANIGKCIDQCIDGRDALKIDKLYLAMSDRANIFIDLLSNKVELGEVIYFSEGKMNLLAGIQQKKGFVALSGTGSAAYAIDNEGEQYVGGLGSLLGDEGSGYEVGKAGIQAAIHHCENSGPKTLITEAILGKWEEKSVREIINSIYRSDCPTSLIASIAKLVSEVALSGDNVALEIYGYAGRSLANQIGILLQTKSRGKDKIVVSGGTWKGCKRMYDSFCENIFASFPDVNIQLPLFEPVMGGVVEEFLTRSRKGEDWEKIQIGFRTLRYHTSWGI